MASTEMMSTYIKKLNHPLKEIRERALQLLVAKLRLGWELEDELACTRELLEALLAWFHVQQPSLQEEALHLLLSTIKTKAGNYIAREMGIKKILSTLNRVKCKVEPDALEIFSDVMDTLRFLNSVASESRLDVPPLTLNSLADSESDDRSSGYYNLGCYSVASKDSLESPEEALLHTGRDMSQSPDGIKVLLLPWVDLCSSDSKTIVLVEDALKLLKSTKRCCRFISDVFLQDFPPEIFLNRPNIIKNLMTIADSGHSNRPEDALFVLLCMTRALRARLRQLCSLDLIHDEPKLSPEQKDTTDNINIELQQITGNEAAEELKEDNALATLRQLPVPIFVLDTLHSILSIMGRSLVLMNPSDKMDSLDLKETNICLNLIESLILLLLDCVSESFWSLEHNSKTMRDIAHKSCTVMRMLGDLMTKYRKLFADNTSKCHYRVAWLRLVAVAEKVLSWTRHSALPPSSIVIALRLAQLDPAVEMLYPQLCNKVSSTLQISRISVDQEYKSKYRELKKLYDNIDSAAQFIKNKSCRTSKKVFDLIEKSLPALELHMGESSFNEICGVILKTAKDFKMNDNDWGKVRSIALSLMAHHVDWVQASFYRSMAEMVRSVLVGDEADQPENEKCLALLFDVGILTEICCHGLSSTSKPVESCASDIMLYLVRGRLVLSEGCWWRLLASLLPVLPLLHVYAEHDTQLGQAICKSLEPDIAGCMGVSLSEVTTGLVRLLFVHCPTVQIDAAHSLCRLLDDVKYLPPNDSLRADILMTALRSVEPQEFNVDYKSSPNKNPSTAGLMQMLDVLKQDLILDEHGYPVPSNSYENPSLEPSLRRSTLQQLSVMLRQPELHDPFINYDGLKIVVAILRMSLTVDDYLAFPECAISCVSILNSVCFMARHLLSKISDLPLFLLRVILVFPANEVAVSMCAQILALVAWAGFSLQELNKNRERVPALPMSVTQRTKLPFHVNSYWTTSPNVQHSSVEWLLSDEDIRRAILMRRWVALESVSRVMLGASPPPAPLSLRPSTLDLECLRASCPNFSCTKALLELENATSHKQVNEAVWMLESYIHLQPLSSVSTEELGALPWHHTRRFLSAPPASSRDTALLISLLRFIQEYMDNVVDKGGAMSWIISHFIDSDASVISLLSRDELYLEQTSQESIEVTQLHTHIVKVLQRCIIHLEDREMYQEKMESLVKILLACLNKIDLTNFHMLGYLNELVRCIRYILNSPYKLSEETLEQCLRLMAATVAGCTAGGGRKGQACRLDALLSLLALLRQVHAERVPVQRWSEPWSIMVVQSVVKCSRGARPELRAAALHVMAALAHHAYFMSHILQALPSDSLAQFAASIFCDVYEANVVRSAAAALLTTLAARTSPNTDIVVLDILEQLLENNFIEHCLDILVEFCNNEKSYNYDIDANISRSMWDRRLELEVRYKKSEDIQISPIISSRGRPPPTASLVAATADVLYNICLFKQSPMTAWNERGLFRLLFRCATWTKDNGAEYRRMRISACRTVYAAAGTKCVRVSLATTKDCLLSLLNTLTPLHEDEIDADNISLRTQTLWLLSALLAERSASDAIWTALQADADAAYFQCLMQCLEGDVTELQDAALFCITKLTQPVTQKKNVDKSKERARLEFFEDLKSRYMSEEVGVSDDDCRPEYMAEDLCKVLIYLYQKVSEDAKIFGNTEERWQRICTCLSCLLTFSPRCRLYAVHRGLPQALLITLRTTRDRLSLMGSVEGVKSAAQNPAINTLYWLFVLIDSQMLDCIPAKETFAEEGIATSLNRLWPWCMLTEELREAVTHLLFTFSNDCEKAWSAMSSCVGSRSLVNEVCALCSREANLQSKPRPDTLLILCLKILFRCVPHHHCRAIILKSEVITSVYKSRVRERCFSPGGAAWARLVERCARHADGAAVLLLLRPLLAAPALRHQLMPALAHLARHRRAALLQAPDLLELLSGTLLAGDVAEMVSAARAVWALAANNHKAKLQLRSAGVASSVQSALQRLQRMPKDAANQRATQLLLYTHSILQTT